MTQTIAIMRRYLDQVSAAADEARRALDALDEQPEPDPVDPVDPDPIPPLPPVPDTEVHVTTDAELAAALHAGKPHIVLVGGGEWVVPQRIRTNELTLRAVGEMPRITAEGNQRVWFDSTQMHRLRLQNLHFPQGMKVLSGFDFLELLHCRFQGCSVQSRSGQQFGLMEAKHCQFVDSWSGTSHAQGCFLFGPGGEAMFEACLFDHNGWRPGASRDDPKEAGGPTIFNHNLYAQVGVELHCIANVFARSSSHGLQARSGGVIRGNLFLECPIGLNFGYSKDGYDSNIASGVIQDNICLYSADISGSNPRGVFAYLDNVRDVQIHNNTAAFNTTSTTNDAFVWLEGKSSGTFQQIRLTNNRTSRWGPVVRNPLNHAADITATGNRFDDDTMVDPQLDVERELHDTRNDWAHVELIDMVRDELG